MGKKKYTLEIMKEKAFKLGYELLNIEYNSISECANLKCLKCGNIKEIKFQNYFYEKECLCKNCGVNPRKIKFEDIKKYVEEESNSGCILLETEESYNYKTNIQPKMALCKIDFRCACGNTFSQSFNAFKSGGKHECNVCSFEKLGRNKSYTNEQVKEYIKNYGCELISEYKSYHEPLLIKCLCGNEFERSFSVFVGTKNRKGVHRCKLCTGASIKFTYEEVSNDLLKHNIELLDDFYINNTTNMNIKYSCGFVVSRDFNNIRKSNYKCPHCTKSGYKRNTAQLKEEIHNATNGEYSLLSEYKTMNDNVTIQHVLCGHIWDTTPHNFLDGGNRCPVCKKSKGEKRVEDYLKINNIEHEPQKEYQGLLGLGGRNLSYDFYLSDYNILIEFQGEQHEHRVEIFHSNEEDFLKQLEHDRRKREYAEINKINLLEIWYWDYDNIEQILSEKLK